MKRNSSRIAARGGSYSMAVTALAAAIAVAVNVLASVLPASATIDGTPHRLRHPHPNRRPHRSHQPNYSGWLKRCSVAWAYGMVRRSPMNGGM